MNDGQVGELLKLVGRAEDRECARKSWIDAHNERAHLRPSRGFIARAGTTTPTARELTSEQVGLEGCVFRHAPK